VTFYGYIGIKQLESKDNSDFEYDNYFNVKDWILSIYRYKASGFIKE